MTGGGSHGLLAHGMLLPEPGIRPPSPAPLEPSTTMAGLSPLLDPSHWVLACCSAFSLQRVPGSHRSLSLLPSWCFLCISLLFGFCLYCSTGRAFMKITSDLQPTARTPHWRFKLVPLSPAFHTRPLHGFSTFSSCSPLLAYIQGVTTSLMRFFLTVLGLPLLPASMTPSLPRVRLSGLNSCPLSLSLSRPQNQQELS